MAQIWEEEVLEGVVVCCLEVDVLTEMVDCYYFFDQEQLDQVEPRDGLS